jgi:hypothetical protein
VRAINRGSVGTGGILIAVSLICRARGDRNGASIVALITVAAGVRSLSWNKDGRKNLVEEFVFP